MSEDYDDGDGVVLQMFLDEKEVVEIKRWCDKNDYKISPMFERRVETAEDLRAKGNEFLKEGDFEKAQHRYFCAINHLDFNMGQYGPAAKPYEDQLSRGKLKAIGNICIARMQHQKYAEVKTAAEIGLRIAAKAELEADFTRATEAKLWYLKGQANLERGFSEDAVIDLKKAEELQDKPEEKVKIREKLVRAMKEKKDDQVKSKKDLMGKLLTEDERLSQGKWWHPSTVLARWRENRRLSGGGCCGFCKHREQEPMRPVRKPSSYETSHALRARTRQRRSPSARRWSG